MSKRWVTREEFTETTAMATDPDRLIRKFLPKMSAHIAVKYAWMEGRGNCVLSVDDLIQVGAICLMKLAGRWAEIVTEYPDYSLGADGTYDAMFYAHLKTVVKRELYNEHRAERRATYESLTVEFDGLEVERSSLYDYTDGEMHDRTGVRRRPDGPWFPAVYDEILSFWYTLTPRDKTGIALHFYDELPNLQVGTLMGLSGTFNHKTLNRWRAHARNQVRVGDDYEEVDPPAKQKPWEPPELLTTYLHDRHRKTLQEYLGIVTISFRVDPDYVARILGAWNFRVEGGANAPSTPEQDAIIDQMASEGYSYAAIGRAVGLSDVTIGRRLDAGVKERQRTRARRAKVRHVNRAAA
jgi:DNA-directed RNA polymerase specialized sigma24 family protein